MATLKESLTFDDVTLVPQFSSILPSEASIETSLGRNLQLKIPFLSSAMDTVTESKMAIAIAKEGGLGIIHRNLGIAEQCKEVKRVKNKKLKVGAAIGTSKDDILRANKLIENKEDLTSDEKGISKHNRPYLYKVKKENDDITSHKFNELLSELYDQGFIKLPEYKDLKVQDNLDREIDLIKFETFDHLWDQLWHNAEKRLERSFNKGRIFCL